MHSRKKLSVVFLQILIKSAINATDINYIISHYMSATNLCNIELQNYFKNFQKNKTKTTSLDIHCTQRYNSYTSHTNTINDLLCIGMQTCTMTYTDQNLCTCIYLYLSQIALIFKRLFFSQLWDLLKFFNFNQSMSDYDDDNVYKVLLIGESSVGKTSIIRVLKGEKFMYSPMCTIGEKLFLLYLILRFTRFTCNSNY